MSTTLIVLITGANQGLGWETARQLSKHSHVHLFMTGRNAERLSEARNKIEAEEGFAAKLEEIVLDVTDDASIASAVKAVEKSTGRLDVLVNNSGVVFDRTADRHDKMTLRQKYQATYEVNVFGAAVMADAFLPLLKKSQSPRILNISSGLGSITMLSDPNSKYAKAQYQVYNSSKSAINAVTVNLGMVHPDIHCVAIDPGHNATGINNYNGPMDPKDGVKVMVEHVLEKKGKSTGYYGHEGELPW